MVLPEKIYTADASAGVGNLAFGAAGVAMLAADGGWGRRVLLN